MAPLAQSPASAALNEDGEHKDGENADGERVGAVLIARMTAPQPGSMQKLIEVDGYDFKLATWDWWYYAEKLRMAKYDLDEEALRPYFKLENVIDGVFAVVTKLWGLQFTMGMQWEFAQGWFWGLMVRSPTLKLHSANRFDIDTSASQHTCRASRDDRLSKVPA